MKSTIMSTWVTVFLGCFFAVATSSQFSLDLQGGMSKQSDADGDRWETGYDVATDGFIYLSDKLGLGARVAFNRYNVKISEFEKDVVGFFDMDVSGSTTIIEVVPSVRVRTTMAGPVNFLGQAGAGLYVLKAESKITGIRDGAMTTVTFDDGKQVGRFGFSFGPGLAIGSWEHFNLQLLPLYNIVIRDPKALQYFTLNAGLMFGM